MFFLTIVKISTPCISSQSVLVIIGYKKCIIKTLSNYNSQYIMLINTLYIQYFYYIYIIPNNNINIKS
jgi:hypothetical protein